MFHCIYRCTNIRSTVVFYSWKVIDSRVFYTTKIYLRNKHFSSYAQALLRTLRYCSRHLTLCVPPLSSWDRSRLNGVTYFCACSSSFSLSILRTQVICTNCIIVVPTEMLHFVLLLFIGHRMIDLIKLFL